MKNKNTIKNKNLLVKLKKYKSSVFILILSLAVIIFGYLYFSEKINTEVSNEEAEEIINEVKKIVVLPEDEVPVVATITDIENLKAVNPSFYKNAQNNDRLLILSDRIIIYNPKEKKIVNFALLSE